MTDILWNVAEYMSIAVCILVAAYFGLKMVSGIIDKIREIRG